jgi:superfamily II DNA or RNA helicase
MAPSNNKEYDRMEKILVRKLNHANLHIECESGTAQELREFFSFFVPGYRFMPAYKNRVWDGKIRLFDANSGELPAGLFYHLEQFADSRKYIVESEKTQYGMPHENATVDIQQLTNYIDSLGLPFRPYTYQLRGIEEGLKRKRAILISPTGSGKSLIIYVLVKYWLHLLTSGLKYPKGGRVLVIVPTTGLVEQMFGDFKSYGQDERGMHRIYSGKDKTFDAAICISTWQSIYKLPKMWYDQFGMIIGDECHGFKSKSLMNIMNKATEAAYRFGTTGTLDGTQTHELVLQGLFGPIHRVTSTKELQDDNTLAQLHIKRIVLDYGEKERLDFGPRPYMDEIDYIVTNEKRNRFIRNLAIDQKGNTLVLYNYVDKHGKPLFDLITDKADEERKVFFVSGKTDTADREAIRGIVEKQKNAIIVASLGTFSTGINIKNLHNIIFASPSKSQIRVLQSIGRGLRKSENNEATTLYDITDDLSWKGRKNFAFIHSEERVKIYEKEKFNHKTYKVNIG